MNWGEMYPEGLATKTADQLMQPKTLAPADTGIWQNFGPGAGSYLMRSFAEVGRATSMLAIGAESLTPSGIAMRALRPDMAEAQQDEAFRQHDEVFQDAVDYWTPKPHTVGKAGEIAGQLAGGVIQFAINPALAVGTAQMNTSTDLVREGVDPGAALVAGDIAGIGTAVGVKLPFLGSTFARKAASGAAGNLVQGVATAGATNMLLQSAGRPDQAAKFDPFDVSARTLDVLLGVAFGGLAHVQTRGGAKIPEMDADQKAALLVVNHSRHLEQSAGPDASPLELTTHVTQVQKAVEQLLRGERVDVEGMSAGPRAQADANLKAWLGDSKVVDANGVPLVAYHGTAANFDGHTGVVSVTTDPQTAGFYAREFKGDGETSPSGGNIQPVYVRLENPKLVDSLVLQVDRYDPEFVARAKADGHDGLAPIGWKPGMPASELVVFDPKQIKSAIGNSGRFDPNSKSLVDQEVSTEIKRLAAETGPPPDIIERPPMATLAQAMDVAPVKDGAEVDARITEGKRAMAQYPDMVIDTGNMLPDGTPERVSAADFVAKAEAELAQAKGTDSNLFRVAAECLLGAL